MDARRQLTKEEYGALSIPVPIGRYLASERIKPESRYRLYLTFEGTQRYSNKRLEDVRRELKGMRFTTGPFSVEFAGVGVRVKRGMETTNKYTWCSVVRFIEELLSAGAWISDSEKLIGNDAIEKAAEEKEAARWSAARGAYGIRPQEPEGHGKPQTVKKRTPVQGGPWTVNADGTASEG